MSVLKKIFTWAALAALIIAVPLVFAAEQFPLYAVRGTGYVLLYDSGGYVFGVGNANPTIQGSSGTGHPIPDTALFYRTDLGTFYSPSSGSWAAATLAGQTLTSTTITSPTISAPTFSGTASGTLTSLGLVSPAVTGSASSGIVVAKRCTFVEDATNTSYTCSITIPALAVVEDVQVIGRVLWNGTSASMDCGDTADPDGFFVTINLKATDLVIGEMLSIKHSTLWGGQEGAYLVAASGRRGATTDNFSMSYVAGSAITCVVTEGAADGTAGRTDVVVLYSTPETVAVTN